MSSVGNEPGQGGVQKALFRDVDEVAALERILNQQAPQEPPDIAEMRQQACAVAEDIVRQAMEQAEQIQKEARETGYRDGHTQGYADGENEARAIVIQRADAERTAFREDIEAFVLHIEQERQRAWSEMEPQIIGLVFQLAQQVIKQEVDVSREVALSITRNALRRVADSSTLRIRVHEEDLETVRAHREELLTLVDGMPNFEIIADRRVGPGGCIVETPAGNIDARIETQMDTVADTLEQMVVHLEKAA
jgi:flagellar assembly protein FliH